MGERIHQIARVPAVVEVGQTGIVHLGGHWHMLVGLVEVRLLGWWHKWVRAGQVTWVVVSDA